MAIVLLMGLFGVISSVLGNDRLAEVPVVIISLAWMALGVITLRYEPAMR